MERLTHPIDPIGNGSDARRVGNRFWNRSPKLAWRKLSAQNLENVGVDHGRGQYAHRLAYVRPKCQFLWEDLARFVDHRIEESAIAPPQFGSNMPENARTETTTNARFKI